MISVEEVKEFLGNVDVPYEAVERAITLARQRFTELKGSEPQDNPKHRKALLLLAVLELSSQVNLYWRREGEGMLRVKELTAEVERLLMMTPKGAVAWAEI